MSGLTNRDREVALFYKTWDKYQKDHPCQRKGQSLFNVLAEVQPAVAEKLRGTYLDPFYHDERIGEALGFIHQQWIPVR